MARLALQRKMAMAAATSSSSDNSHAPPHASKNLNNKSDFVESMRSRLKSSSTPTTASSSTPTTTSSSPHPTLPVAASQRTIHDIKKKRTNRGTTSGGAKMKSSLEPYVGKLERFELFSTHQAYYLVACDKHNTTYRVLRMDRTVIEQPQQQAPKNSAMPSENTYDNISSPPNDTDDNNHNNTYNNNAETTTARHSDWNTSTATTTPNPSENHASSVDGHESVREDQHGNPLPNKQDPLPSIQPRKTTYRRLPEFCVEDPHIYSPIEIQEMLDMIHDGNKTVGGLRPVAKAYGVVGFVKFLDCYYLTLITKRAKVGSIGTNGIYSIKGTETFPLKPAERMTGNDEKDGNPGDPSSMLLNMWNRGKRSVGLGLTNREIAELRYQGLYQVIDLTKNFFFSYTYDITRSLQENFLCMSSQPFPPPPFKEMYAWNFFLTRELEECCSSLTSSYWVLPIVHGAFIQRKLNDYGRTLNIILLARRSRHFAGTRYLKRGVSDRGKVANDVEHEQILHDETTTEIFSSFLQMRGSIPTYWTQESSVTMPKPPIVLNRVDPTYQATQAHFEDLLKRYGSPIVVCDLVKQSEKREREVIVGNEYRHAIDYLNSYIEDEHKIRYCALDYSHISKHRNLNVSTSLNEVATWAVNQTGFFCSAPRWKITPNGTVAFDSSLSTTAAFISQQLGVPVFPMEQKGVLRTNCIDCLDRTNVAQFSAGVEALAQQLVVMGIRSSESLDPSSNIVRVLIDMYVEIGDHIALQYGGSEAHKKGTVGTSSNVQPSMGKHKELLTSIRRYYSNTFTDRLKQDAMNLFLGYYIPSRHTVPLWDLENDYYLHNFHIRSGAGSLQSMKAYERTFAVDWSDDDSTSDPPPQEEKDSNSNISSPSPNRRIKRRTNRLRTSKDPPSLDTDIASTFDTEENAGTIILTDRSHRMRRVSKRCHAQNVALSTWWRVAIQSYMQQRMWMPLGRHSKESLLPPKFERFYQPTRLTQFDKIFAKGWASPMRLSHNAARQGGGLGEDLESPLRRTKMISMTSQAEQDNDDNEDGKQVQKEEQEQKKRTIGEFVDEYGFKGTTEPSLTHFIKHFEAQDISPRDETKEVDGSYHFLGSLNQSNRSAPCQEYVHYANNSNQPDAFSISHSAIAYQEFTKSLYENNLASDDVEGIRKLAESAHIGSFIQTGLYRGLPQNESAVKVTTVIHEQYNALANMKERGELRNNATRGFDVVEDALKRSHMNLPGIKKQISEGWDKFNQSEEAFCEIVDTKSLGWKRSDLTTESSMKLYCSFFDDKTMLSGSHMSYMLGKKLPKGDVTSNEQLRPPSRPLPKRYDKERTTAFSTGTTKSTTDDATVRRDNQCQSCKDDDIKALFAPMIDGNRDRVRPGFEQINEDLYARKDNKFMVFNGAAVDTWRQGKQLPVTKTAGIETDFFIG